MIYQETASDDDVIGNCILCIENGKIIPKDPANTDYQEYLAWLAAGNTPEPADQ
jgi:hypothetical protein